MKLYIDITLLPSDDIGIHFLWSKVMMQVHLALVEIQDGNKQVPVAVGFPNYRNKSTKSAAFIGNKIRLYTIKLSDFENLNINKWLNRLEDYVHIKAINNVPEKIDDYESFNRMTKAGSADKHIRRRMARHKETIEQAAEYYTGYVMDKDVKTLPFIKMKSLGSGEAFNMSIRRNQVKPSNQQVLFSTYGLNKDAALPVF